MISVILSAVVLALVSFGGVVEATRKTNLRLQQNLAAENPCHEFQKKKKASDQEAACVQCVKYEATAMSGSDTKKISCTWNAIEQSAGPGKTSNCVRYFQSNNQHRTSPAFFKTEQQCKDKGLAERKTLCKPASTCKQCFAFDPHTMAGQNPCVWTNTPADGESKCREKEANENGGYISRVKNCLTAARQAIGRAIKSVDTNLAGIAGVDPSMEEYATASHTQGNFWKLSGNYGYCWRYSAAQSLGMPYLVFESMIKTIQAYLRKENKMNEYRNLAKTLSRIDKNDEGRAGKDDPEGGWRKKLTTTCTHSAPISPKPTVTQARELCMTKSQLECTGVYVSDCTAGSPAVSLCADSVLNSKRTETPGNNNCVFERPDDGGDEGYMILDLQKFVEAEPDAKIYKTILKNARGTGEKNHDGGVEDDAQMDQKLRHLITCVEIPKTGNLINKMDNPTLEKIEDFLKGNPKWRRVILEKPGAHVGVLLLDTGKMLKDTHENKLYFADGNGKGHDGELFAMFEDEDSNNTPHQYYGQFKQDMQRAPEDKIFKAYKVNRDKCEPKSEF